MATNEDPAAAVRRRQLYTSPARITSADLGDFKSAVEEFTRALPGWGFRIGLYAHGPYCSVAPDVNFIDETALNIFEHGFDYDLRRPDTMADALRGATKRAREALDIYNRTRAALGVTKG